jgi:hypothetical protein
MPQSSARDRINGKGKTVTGLPASIPARWKRGDDSVFVETEAAPDPAPPLISFRTRYTVMVETTHPSAISPGHRLTKIVPKIPQSGEPLFGLPLVGAEVEAVPTAVRVPGCLIGVELPA